jgi:hypothetical protein
MILAIGDRTEFTVSLVSTPSLGMPGHTVFSKPVALILMLLGVLRIHMVSINASIYLLNIGVQFLIIKSEAVSDYLIILEKNDENY